MEIIRNASLRPYNTFGIDVMAAHMAEASSADEIKELLAYAKSRKINSLVIGGGSNILFTKNVDALVILNRLKGITYADADEQSVLVTCAAGEAWGHLVNETVSKGLGGIENLTLIPGNAGAAPMQNIGAYGAELKDVFHSLIALHIQTGEVKTFNTEACEFGYRESVFKRRYKGQFIILSISLRLKKKPLFNTAYGAIEEELHKQQLPKTLQNISKVVADIRRSKLPDPLVLGNAGSFFKNPTVSAVQFQWLKSTFPELPSYALPGQQYKIPAGWLIEKCGLKGFVKGHCGVHKNQALVLVNLGGAQGNEVFELSEFVIQEVQRTFQIILEREVNIY